MVRVIRHKYKLNFFVLNTSYMSLCYIIFVMMNTRQKKPNMT